MSHVVPDLVQKVLKGQDPLHILGTGEQIRHYTYGGDLARGIITAMDHPDATNEDFNLSTAESTSVLKLAEVIWRKIKGADVPLRVISDDPFEYDVQRRVPSTEKAKRMLGFEATTSLETMLDEVIPWIAQAVENGTLYRAALAYSTRAAFLKVTEGNIVWPRPCNVRIKGGADVLMVRDRAPGRPSRAPPPPFPSAAWWVWAVPFWLMLEGVAGQERVPIRPGGK